ncbi:glycoside hydrolase family 88 protein [Ferruginibacter sp. HRS2-29]|uniref:glycoside hydrolase family 88 protein n=1 Tax=Ferruginibacter sp. HRS2-29 TaxID=2487334 RepID=UPI0020CE0BC1|nr:glycoside hydrolase family 88 protein [Ferruginibacter sp. HRS2-29]MCP9749832.1 glucuronyl hydrolase [Ferruginibacter sp. HRS2-29]
MPTLRISLLLFFAAFSFNFCCAQGKKVKPLSQKKIAALLHDAAEKYRLMDQSLQPDQFPRSLDTSGNLVTNNRGWWTSGFFPGSLWYLYEFTKDSAVKNAAIRRTKAVEKESLNTGDHDIGFKIWCSVGNQLRITKDTAATLPVILDAAKSLSERFDPTVGLIRSWGKLDDPKEFLVIIDNMMNLELLFEATKLSGDSSFYRIAISHADKTMTNHFRADGSSYHVVNYDGKTGNVIVKRTAQGFADNSAWARGQAWGLYGYTMCYRETKDKRYLEQAKKIAGFLLNHPNLPADKIPYWDFNAPNIPAALRDASAASIIASALLELSGYATPGEAELYRTTANTIVSNLGSDQYLNKKGEQHHFILKHSVGHLPAKSEVDVPLSYADYYYIESLMRLR